MKEEFDPQDKTFDLTAETKIFGDLLFCENKQGNQLPGVLFVIV